MNRYDVIKLIKETDTIVNSNEQDAKIIILDAFDKLEKIERIIINKDGDKFSLLEEIENVLGVGGENE